MGKTVVADNKSKVVKIDETKKARAIEFMTSLITNPDFPKIPKTEVEKLAKENNVPEKNLTAFMKRLEKFYNMVAKRKEKKSKVLDASLEEKVKDATQMLASGLATKLYKTSAKLSKVQVTKMSNKQNKNACGKTIFTLGNGKDVFMYWEYKDGNIFAGSALHEVTKE